MLLLEDLGGDTSKENVSSFEYYKDSSLKIWELNKSEQWVNESL